MKRIYYYLSILLATLCLSTACTDEINGEEEVEDDGTVKTILEQKQYMEKVALEFMDAMPSSDFDDLGDLGEYIADNYIDDYDWDDVGEWAEDVFNGLREATGTTNTKTEAYYSYTYKYIYTNFNAVILASNFSGHFTASNGRWVRTKADDLQFIFKDKYGKQCVASLETSGKVQKVYAGDIEDWQDYKWEGYTSTDYIDRTKCTIGVPEKIVVTLTQGGKKKITTTINIDLGSISNNRFDIAKNNLTLSALLELDNGYKFNISQVAYSANKNIAISFIMSKEDKTLLALGVSSDIEGLPSCEINELTSEDFDEDDYNFDNSNIKNAYVNIDILGKVQIKGSIVNIRNFADYIEEADDNYRNESKFKSYIAQANDLLDVNVFYDKKKTKQASIKLEPFADETWNGTTYWSAEPVMTFSDESSYSTFEAFFNEKDFKNTIDSFKRLANKYANIIGERIDW